MAGVCGWMTQCGLRCQRHVSGCGRDAGVCAGRGSCMTVFCTRQELSWWELHIMRTARGGETAQTGAQQLNMGKALDICSQTGST